MSNGNSKVLIKDNITNQYFNHPLTYQKVKKITSILKKKPITTIILDKVQYTFNGLDFHTYAIDYKDDESRINWENILCLNQIDNYIEIYMNNTEKFYWDILRAITYINICGYEHNDVSMDNIGIRNGNFILFDYDMSKKSNDLFTEDLYKLFRSIKFNTGTIKLQFWSILEYVFLIKKIHDFTNIKETLNYLDKLEIIK